MTNEMWVPAPIVFRRVYELAPSEPVPAWLLVSLSMSFFHRLAIEDRILETFGPEACMVSCDEVVRAINFNVFEEDIIDAEIKTAAWKILYDYLDIRPIRDQDEYMSARRILFPQEDPRPAVVIRRRTDSHRSAAVTGQALVELSPASIPATADQIALICGKFGGATQEVATQPTAMSVPKKERVRSPIPVDPKLADPNYGATKKAPVKKASKTPEKKRGRGPGQRRAA